MKKFITALVFTAATCWLLSYVLPWWSVAVAGAFVAFAVPQKGGPSFFAGFLGVFIVWACAAMLISGANDGLLAARIGGLLGEMSPLLLILTGALLGAFVGGMGALTGFLGRRALGSA